MSAGLESSAAGHWAVVMVLLPVAAGIGAFLIPRVARGLALASALGILWAGGELAAVLLTAGPVHYPVGGWGAPLGIELYVDGLSGGLAIMTALVGSAVTLYSASYLRPAHHGPDDHAALRSFWPLWLVLWGALAALLFAGDVFNIYVTLELVGLGAVALTALRRDREALAAALRYLLVGILGSMSYLLGVALLYAAYGRLDLAGLTQVMQANPVSYMACALMVGGLAFKAALFPLHGWLPPAHASAMAPASAVLSALVVKTVLYILVRLWFGPFTVLVGEAAAQLLGIAGGLAIIWGSYQAMTAVRLKLMVAYSTVAQLGYIVLIFPLAVSAAGSVPAWGGGLLMALAHGLAKAGMFLAAGCVLLALGHDRVAGLAGLSQRQPVTLAALAIAAVSLIGLPPSGGFAAKWMLLDAALTTGQWWWVPVILVGTLFAAGYLFRIVGIGFRTVTDPPGGEPVPASLEWAALALALLAVMLGLFVPDILGLLHVGATLGEAPL